MSTSRKVAALTSVALVAALTACSPGSSGTDDGVVTLEFETLVWQPGAIAANDEIVKQWNEENPDIQVNLVRGAWSGMRDKLVTGFEAGQAPDVFHWDAKRTCDFAEQGSILNLEPYISDEQMADITEGAWDGVRRDTFEGVCGIPFLLEADVLYANKATLDEAGIELPTMDDPWTWQEYREIAASLTVDDNGDGTPEIWGGGIPMEGPTSRIMRLSLGNDGFYFEQSDDATQVVFGPAEQLVPQVMHDMLYVDKTVSPADIGRNTEDMLPTFFEGTTATFLGESWVRDQIVENAPEGFDWVLLPPLLGTSLNQPASSQVLAASASTDHPEEAAKFISWYTNPQNQVKMALGDAMIPTSLEAAQAPEMTTTEFGWNVVSAMGEHLVAAPVLESEGFNEWAEKVANPAFDRYLRDEIDMDELGRLLVEDGQSILDRYNR